MSPGLQELVLKIVLVIENEPAGLGQAGELPQTIPVPGIGPLEVVEAEAIPGRSPSATGKGLFVKWGEDGAVGAPDAQVSRTSVSLALARIRRG